MRANIAGAVTHPTVLACEFDHGRDAFLPRWIIRTVGCLSQPGLRHPHCVGIDKLSRRFGSLLNPGKVVGHAVDLHAESLEILRRLEANIESAIDTDEHDLESPWRAKMNQRFGKNGAVRRAFTGMV